MSKIVLYSQEISPPCRAVLLTAHAIGLDLEVRTVDLLSKEQLSEEFKKINPQHTIPVLDDNGFVLSDSHAIVCYLVDKYAKDDSLYPKDLQKRALVHSHLFFDTGVLFPALKNGFKPVIVDGMKTLPQEKLAAMKEAHAFLDKFLEDRQWLVGDSYTLADLCCVATVCNLGVVLSLDEYPNVKAWQKRCEEQLPGYEKVNVPGMLQLHALVQSKLGL